MELSANVAISLFRFHKFATCVSVFQLYTVVWIVVVHWFVVITADLLFFIQQGVIPQKWKCTRKAETYLFVLQKLDLFPHFFKLFSAKVLHLNWFFLSLFIFSGKCFWGQISKHDRRCTADSLIQIYSFVLSNVVCGSSRNRIKLNFNLLTLCLSILWIIFFFDGL